MKGNVVVFDDRPANPNKRATAIAGDNNITGEKSIQLEVCEMETLPPIHTIHLQFQTAGRFGGD